MYIESVEMMNCQSIKHVKYQFRPGLNVIVAENSTGKSVLYKALKIAVGTDYIGIRDLKHFLSYGEKTCGCIFTISDGTTGGFVSDGKSIFYLYNGVRYTEPQQGFISKLGALVDRGSKFFLNMLDPDQDLLFVNSKESTNYSILRMLSDCGDYEEFVDRIDTQLTECTEVYNNVSRELATTNAMMSTFRLEDIDLLESKANTCAMARDIMKWLVDLYEQMQNVVCLDKDQLTNMSLAVLLLDVSLLLSKVQCISTEEFSRLNVSVLMCEMALCLSKLQVSDNSVILISDTQELMFDLVNKVSKLTVISSNEYESTVLCEFYLNLAISMSKLSNVSNLKKEYEEFISSLPHLQCQLYGEVIYFEEGCVPV